MQIKKLIIPVYLNQLCFFYWQPSEKNCNLNFRVHQFEVFYRKKNYINIVYIT